jgi:hypothetical protein
MMREIFSVKTSNGSIEKGSNGSMNKIKKILFIQY